RGGAPPRRGGRRGSLLDPYRPVVDQLLGEGVWNTVVILRELQAKGYTGGVSILRDYVRPKRALRTSGRATVRFETEPGRQLQTDWAVQSTIMPSIPMRLSCAPSSGSAARPPKSSSTIRRPPSSRIDVAATFSSTRGSWTWPATMASARALVAPPAPRP